MIDWKKAAKHYREMCTGYHIALEMYIDEAVADKAKIAALEDRIKELESELVVLREQLTRPC